VQRQRPWSLSLIFSGSGSVFAIVVPLVFLMKDLGIHSLPVPFTKRALLVRAYRICWTGWKSGLSCSSP